MALINQKCIGEPELCSRSDAPMPDRQGTTTTNRQNQKKLSFKLHLLPMQLETRNYVEHNSVENVSQDLVHLTKSDTSASASLISESEEREEIAETITETVDVPAPAPAPALERVDEQSHTPGSRKSMRKNLGRPASSYSDFYM